MISSGIPNVSDDMTFWNVPTGVAGPLKNCNFCVLGKVTKMSSFRICVDTLGPLCFNAFDLPLDTWLYVWYQGTQCV